MRPHTRPALLSPLLRPLQGWPSALPAAGPTATSCALSPACQASPAWLGAAHSAPQAFSKEWIPLVPQGERREGAGRAVLQGKGWREVGGRPGVSVRGLTFPQAPRC